MEIGSLIQFESPSRGMVEVTGSQTYMFNLGTACISANEIAIVCGIRKCSHSGEELAELMIGSEIIFDVSLNQSDFKKIG